MTKEQLKKMLKENLKFKIEEWSWEYIINLIFDGEIITNFSLPKDGRRDDE